MAEKVKCNRAMGCGRRGDSCPHKAEHEPAQAGCKAGDEQYCDVVKQRTKCLAVAEK